MYSYFIEKRTDSDLKISRFSCNRKLLQNQERRSSLSEILKYKDIRLITDISELSTKLSVDEKINKTFKKHVIFDYINANKNLKSIKQLKDKKFYCRRS